MHHLAHGGQQGQVSGELHQHDPERRRSHRKAIHREATLALSSCHHHGDDCVLCAVTIEHLAALIGVSSKDVRAALVSVEGDQQ
jgi:hypothetical protein